MFQWSKGIVRSTYRLLDTKLVRKHQSSSKTLCFSDRRALLHQLTDYWTENYCGKTDGGL